MGTIFDKENRQKVEKVMTKHLFVKALQENYEFPDHFSSEDLPVLQKILDDSAKRVQEMSDEQLLHSLAHD